MEGMLRVGGGFGVYGAFNSAKNPKSELLRIISFHFFCNGCPEYKNHTIKKKITLKDKFRGDDGRFSLFYKIWMAKNGGFKAKMGVFKAKMGKCLSSVDE